MKILGTCRKDDRKTVAAALQTVTCIIPSLPAGSRHTAIKAKRVVRPGRNDPSENIADGGGSSIIFIHPSLGAGHPSVHRTTPDPLSSFQPFHCVLVAPRQGLRSRTESSWSNLRYKITEKQRKNFTT